MLSLYMRCSTEKSRCYRYTLDGQRMSRDAIVVHEMFNGGVEMLSLYMRCSTEESRCYLYTLDVQRMSRDVDNKIRLLAVLNKFFQPIPITAEEFLLQWRSLAAPPLKLQEVVRGVRPMSLGEMTSLLNSWRLIICLGLDIRILKKQNDDLKKRMEDERAATEAQKGADLLAWHKTLNG
ncbi:AP-2 complex subunit alpha-1-like protein [Tanacetum coccineum]